MFHASEAIERFFRTFEANTSSEDIDTAVAPFAQVFMAAGPQGTQAVHAADFARALPKRKQLFQDLGHQSTQLISLTEKRLDARFVLATTQWKMSFTRAEDPPKEIVVDSMYIVDAALPEPKIVFYLANQDLMQVLNNSGIMHS